MFPNGTTKQVRIKTKQIKGFNNNLIYFSQISKGLSAVLIRSKSIVSNINTSSYMESE